MISIRNIFFIQLFTVITSACSNCDKANFEKLAVKMDSFNLKNKGFLFASNEDCNEIIKVKTSKLEIDTVLIHNFHVDLIKDLKRLYKINVLDKNGGLLYVEYTVLEKGDTLFFRAKDYEY